MSASDTLHTVSLHRDPRRRSAPHLHDSGPDVEILARRALGVAMNALSNGGHVSPLAAREPSLVEHAKALLARRVPAGPELALALDLLDGAAAPSTASPAAAMTTS